MAIPLDLFAKNRVLGPRTVSQVSTRWQVQTHDTRMGWQQGSVDLGSQGPNSSWKMTFFFGDGFPLEPVPPLVSDHHYSTCKMDLKKKIALQHWDTGSFLPPCKTPSPTVTQPSQLGSQRQSWRGCRCMAARSHPTPVSLPCFRQSYFASSVVEDELFNGYRM